MRRDYQAEGAQIDKFSLRVPGTRFHRRDPLGPDEALKYNMERTADRKVEG